MHGAAAVGAKWKGTRKGVERAALQLSAAGRGSERADAASGAFTKASQVESDHHSNQNQQSSSSNQGGTESVKLRGTMADEE